MTALAPAITPEMIEAGRDEVRAFIDGVDTSEELAIKVYHAMRSKAQKCDCKDGE